MSKVGNYIVGASVVAIMAGSPVEAEAHNNYGDDNTNDKDKVVYVEENLRDSLKNDNTIAWEMVANNEQELRNATSSNQTKEELKEELKEDSWRGYGTIREVGRAPRIDNLQYQNDTVSVKPEADAYYSPDLNTITDNIVEGQEQSIESTLSTLAHEAEHMHQREKVNFSADMSLEQHYKLHCYKEIGAQVAGLLQLREMYKEAQTEEERANIIKEGKKEGYKDYFSKVENGEINPLSDKKEDFDKEMSVVINSVGRHWMSAYADFYDDKHAKMALSDAMHADVLPNEENYKEGVSLLLTIGGIDFSQYLNEDIDCYNKSVKDIDKKIQNGEDFFDINYQLVSNNNADHRYSGIEFNEIDDCKGFSLEQRYNLAVQKAFADKIKDAGLADLVTMYMDNGFETIDADITRITKEICELNDVNLSSWNLVIKLGENEGIVGKASDKEYLEKLREIWTAENSKGEKVCLLDGMLEKPDFSEYVSSSYPLEQLDNRPFLVKVRENIKEKLHKNDKEDDNRATDFQFSSSISDIKPLEAPNYTMSPTRSEVMTTSDIIDTRTDYLAQEREGRIEQAKQMLNEDLRNIHPKTETVDLNRQRLNDELSSIQPKTEKVNTGSEVLIALAQQGRGM